MLLLFHHNSDYAAGGKLAYLNGKGASGPPKGNKHAKPSRVHGSKYGIGIGPNDVFYLISSSRPHHLPLLKHLLSLPPIHCPDRTVQLLQHGQPHPITTTSRSELYMYVGLTIILFLFVRA